MSQHLPMEETEVFRKAEELADRIWEVVSGWKPFERETVGKQLVRAADSIAANLAEGDGRYSDAEAIHFFVIARASGRETAYWLRRAKRRSPWQPGLAEELLLQLEIILKLLNGLINYRRGRGKLVREETALYNAENLTPNT